MLWSSFGGVGGPREGLGDPGGPLGGLGGSWVAWLAFVWSFGDPGRAHGVPLGGPLFIFTNVRGFFVQEILSAVAMDEHLKMDILTPGTPR